MVTQLRGCSLVAMVSVLALLAGGCADGDEDIADTELAEGDSEGTGEPDEAPPIGIGCAALLSVDSCMDQPGCGPVFGHALLDQGESWCTDADQIYLGCIETIAQCPTWDEDCDPCPGGERIVCDDDGYWLANGCVPEGFDACAAPGPLAGSC